MSSPNPDLNPNDPDACPKWDWCRMHLDGQHLGELQLRAEVKGHRIYTREFDDGSSELAASIEVVIVPPGGGEPRRIPIPPGEVLEAAMMSDLMAGIAAMEGTQPGADPDARP
ncbi:hypothetical protein [Actinoplanes sp. URMC 104]|uniref:hypothetical protein n=1 Tax=Actinoplanes sp. URMC 104 TaxID=3423409 RepID=UPI003F197E59